MSIKIAEIKKSCLDKWCNSESELDDRLKTFNEKFESWIQQIPPENRSTVITLVENLEYYSHRFTNSWLKTLHSRLLESPGISDENTIYVFIKSKDGQTNSSNDYWTEYKAINRLNKHICIENMDVLEYEDWQHIKNIVFIDDFSGSGKSFIDELNKCPNRYKNKNVYFITINSMILAVDKINKYCTENNIHITMLSAFNQHKTFERDLFTDNAKAKEEIRKMSNDLLIPKNEIMGYNKSQALAVFYNNTPNNTLGFIRYDTDVYNSLFPRKNDSIPLWKKMRKERNNRNKANYNNKAIGDNNE